MKTIKFRGKRIDNGEWVFGYYIHKNIPNKTYIISQDSQNYKHEVVPETVGQFIGLFNKEGIEIYEDDIIHAESKQGKNYITSVNGCSVRDRIVIWLENEAQFSWKLLDGQINSSGFTLCKNNSERFFETIGNIYEHSELIKQ